ncbi:MAG: hypothetical protein JWM26_189 [Betaproteobacteria bacterium]|nr:hypothetical protein [Betaproteobacteria bacterium]
MTLLSAYARMTLLRVQRDVGAVHECGVVIPAQPGVVIPAQAGIHFDLVCAEGVVPFYRLSCATRSPRRTAPRDDFFGVIARNAVTKQSRVAPLLTMTLLVSLRGAVRRSNPEALGQSFAGHPVPANSASLLNAFTFSLRSTFAPLSASRMTSIVLS